MEQEMGLDVVIFVTTPCHFKERPARRFAMSTFHDPFLRQSHGCYSTSGFWIGQKHNPQKKRIYGHPILLGDDGKNDGAFGFGGDLRCPKCGGIFDFLVIEFKEAIPFSMLLDGNLEEEFAEEITKCPKCGHREMELEAT